MACNFTPQTSIPSCAVSVERNAAVIGCLSPGDSWRLERPQYAVDRVGYGGIVLVKAYDGQYYAFDLSCPVEASSTIRVGKADALMVTCPVCGETYYLGDGLGVPQKGISQFTLLRYRTYYSATGIITITN